MSNRFNNGYQPRFGNWNQNYRDDYYGSGQQNYSNGGKKRQFFTPQIYF